MTDIKKYYSIHDYDLAAYSNRLFKIRDTLNFTMREMAETLNVNVSTYQLNESGKIKKIPATIVEALVEKLHVDINTLLVPLSKSDLSPNILIWATSSKAAPYIIEAYQKYLQDKENERNKRKEEIENQIEKYKGDNVMKFLLWCFIIIKGKCKSLPYFISGLTIPVT